MTNLAHHLPDKERTCDIETDENVTFSDLLLSEQVLEGLHAAGFFRPSPIQLAAIPLGRCGLDLVIQAKSGTGKTCVLAVVALEAVITASPATQVVVVAPTREVAVQVSQVVSVLASAMPGLSTAAFIGGTKLADDKVKLEGCQVVVGTPGRLTQLVSLGLLKVQCVRLIVLDEADRLLEGNFLDPVTQFIKAFPHNKQMLCLSATFSDNAAIQAESLMRSPSHVRLDRESPALLGVNQVVCRLPTVTSPHKRQAAKEAELLRLLSQVTFNQCLVFSGSQLRAESVCHRLKAQGWPAEYLTAAQSQTERLAALEALCSHRCRILVATDLAARGLDSAHVNLVVSLDLPPEPATYLHRAGRAGRFGSRGAAVMLVCSPEEWYGIRAITTLANVKLLLAGKDWISHLATKKVEGRKKILGKEEDDGVKDKQNVEKEGIEKQEENDGTEKVEETLGEGKDENNSKLEVVDHLCDEEARNWLKHCKPYKKNSLQPTSQNENKQSHHKEKKGKTFKGNKNNIENKMQNYINGQNLSTPEVMKTKVSMNQPHIEVQHHVNEGQIDDEKDEEENEGNKVNNSFTQTYINGAQSQTEKEEEQSDAEKEGLEETDLNLSSKTTAVNLVNRLWERHPTVTMSYPQLLSECREQYSKSSLKPEMRVKVPSWPVQVEASDREMVSLERCVNSVQVKVRDRERSWDGRRFDASPVLTALSERKDAWRVLEEARGQVLHTATERIDGGMSDETAQQVPPAAEVKEERVFDKVSSEVSPMIESKDRRKLDETTHVPVAGERTDRNAVSKETRLEDSHDSSHHSINNFEKSNHTILNDATSVPIDDKDPEELLSSTNQLSLPKNPESSTEQYIPLSTTHVHHSVGEHTEDQPYSHGSQPSHITGARPKERKQRKKEQQEKDAVTHSLHHRDYQNDKHIENCYQDRDSFSHLIHQDRQNATERKKERQGRDVLDQPSYHQDYHDRKEYHDRNVLNDHQKDTRRKKGHQDTYVPNHLNYNPQVYNSWEHNPWYPTQESYQNTTSNNSGYYDQGYDYSEAYPNQYQGYQDYNQWHSTYDQGNAYHHYPQPTSHIDAYIKNACKFASMMEYVSMMGRMSLHIAEDYHSRRKQWYDEQAAGGTSGKSTREHNRRMRRDQR